MPTLQTFHSKELTVVYTLNSFKDAKILVVVFTCNHCPDATAARDKINQFAIDYKSKGVEVVAISASPQGVQVWENMFSKYDDDFESMKLVAKDHALVHPYLYGEKPPQTVVQAYGAVATPHLFIFDEERKLRYQGNLTTVDACTVPPRRRLLSMRSMHSWKESLFSRNHPRFRLLNQVVLERRPCR